MKTVFKVLIKYFSRHLEEGLDVLASLGGGLEEERDVATFLKISGLLNTNFTLLLSVFLISDKDNNYTGLRLINDLIVPSLKVFECFPFGDVICQEDTIRTFIEYPGD